MAWYHSEIKAVFRGSEYKEGIGIGGIFVTIVGGQGTIKSDTYGLKSSSKTMNIIWAVLLSYSFLQIIDKCRSEIRESVIVTCYPLLEPPTGAEVSRHSTCRKSR